MKIGARMVVSPMYVAMNSNILIIIDGEKRWDV
jgi:hypothetical protein